MDEGQPFTGKVRVRAPNVTTCAEGGYAGGANAVQIAANEYNLDTSGNICNLMFKIN